MSTESLFLKNKELNREEIKERKTILFSHLTSLICALTNKCNIQCIMCDTWRQHWEIPEKTFTEVLTLLPYLEHVIWLGGEVFLYPHFDELLEETKKYPHIAQRINTSGLLITEEWAEKLFQNNVELIYSIDGVTKEIYEHIRKRGHFEDLIKSLEIIKRMRKKYNKKFELMMNVVVMKSNYREIERFIDFAKEYEFKLVQFMPITGEGTPEYIFSDRYKNAEILKYLDNVIEKLQEEARQYNIQLINSLPSDHDTSQKNEIDTSTSNKKNLFCYLPWQQILIYPDGNVRFGCFCEDPIGSVLENSIEEIWNSEKAQEYRRKISANTYQNLCSERCVQGRISMELRKVGEVDQYFSS